MTNSLLSYKNEIFRKSIHSTSIFIPIAYIFIDYSLYILLLTITAITIICINISFNKYLSKIPIVSKVFSLVLRPYEKGNLWGSSYMLIGFCIITLIFNKNITITAMFITSISDSMAAIIGMKYGKIKLLNNKTLEGSFTFMISTYLIFFLTINVYTNILKLCTISFLISLIELITPTKFDNLTIPIGSALILYLSSIQL